MSGTTVTDAEKTILRDYPGAPPEDVRVLAVEIDEQAELILRANPALGRSTALAQAYQIAQDNKRFAGLTPRRKVPGKSANAPLDVPMKGGKIDTTKLQPNMFYKGTGQWAGSTFVWEAEKGKFTRLTQEDIDRYDLRAAGLEGGDEDEGADEGNDEDYEEEE
jgi:hypothetical protein